MARVHRIGQSKPVTVYRFLTKNTYEMFMFDIASKKLGLNYAIMNDIEISASSGKGTSLTSKEIENLLRFGAYDIFNNIESDNSISNESIDYILEHCSTVIENKGPTEKNCFSKAVFVAGNDETISMNDPHFWDKLLPAIEQAPEERKVRRRAKCNYKETAVYSESSSYENDSGDEDEESSHTSTNSLSAECVSIATNSTSGRRRKDVPYNWTSPKLNKVTSAVFQWGYPNFLNIKQRSEIGKKYTVRELAVGSRLVVLGVLRYIVSRTDGFCHRMIDGKLQEIAIGEDSGRYEDLLNLRHCYAKSKTCRLIVHVVCSGDNANELTEDNLLRAAVSGMKLDETSFFTRSLMTDEELIKVYRAFGDCTFDYKFKSLHRMRSFYKSKLALLDNILEAYTLTLMISMNISPITNQSRIEQHRAYNPHTDDLLSFLMSMLPEEEAPAKWWCSVDDVMLLFGIVKVLAL